MPTRQSRTNSRRLLVELVESGGARYGGFLRRKLYAAHRLLGASQRELSVALVDDATMIQVHKTFLRQARPTDVLSFPLEHDSRGRVLSGEIIICLPQARRRAKELGTRVRDELLLYAIHGMLHLSGFDDRTQREFERMHRTEDRILSRLGVGPVFSPKPKPRKGAT